MKKALQRWLPILHWLPSYKREQLIADLSAAAIVTVLLVPQSLAYALLAGLPATVGLYASILPLLVYAIFGTSRTLSVGPVAVISLMTASTIGSVSQTSQATPAEIAIALSFLSGALLLAMGVLRLGFITNFLSHSVIAGFINASSLIIIFSQLKYLLGLELEDQDVWHQSLSIHWPTALLAGFLLLFLFGAKSWGVLVFEKSGISKRLIKQFIKLTPAIAVVVTIGLAILFDFKDLGIHVIGRIPQGLPEMTLSIPPLSIIQQLWLPALMIALIGYTESIAVGTTLAAKRRQTIDSNNELLALGAANISSGISSAMPVTGGFSRSAVNFDSGAQTQMAGIFAAIGIAIITTLFTPLLYHLPKVTLAATIIVAVFSLIDLTIFKKTWQFSKADFAAVCTTVAGTLLAGVEIGIVIGIASSMILFIYRASTPHTAELGLVLGSNHFRNIERYTTTTHKHLYLLRIDESLFFANCHQFERDLYETLYKRDAIYHVVFICHGINSIDYTALETLERINSRLAEQGIKLHLTEVKGPVSDALIGSHFIEELSGSVFITTNEAFTTLQQATEHSCISNS